MTSIRRQKGPIRQQTDPRHLSKIAVFKRVVKGQGCCLLLLLL